MKSLVLALLLISSLCAIEIIDYYGVGCPHCAQTDMVLSSLEGKYDFTVIKKEVRSNPANLEEMLAAYRQFGQDPNSGGVPTLVIDNTTMIVGEMPKEKWERLLDDCSSSKCPAGVFTRDTLYADGGGPTPAQVQELTVFSLVAAALVDSINPCTIAVMAMLLGMILISDGRKKMLVSGLLFISIVFICYLAMGLGILKVIDSPALTNIFYSLATIGLLVIAALEIRAYFEYKPGFLAIEMPTFLRPYAKAVIEKATSLPGIAVAALFCSIFLLPCSSGPYLAVLAILAKGATAEYMGYLILYNIIFVLPMVAVTLAIYGGYTTVEKVGEAKEKFIREIHLISGVILFLVFVYMAHAMLNWF
ncbi:MAG: hypothetical protein QXH30_00120 [Candidatus Bilamarchaeaceae archaeon]